MIDVGVLGSATFEADISQAKVAAALTYCLDEQTKAVEANDKLHTAIEEFHAHRLGLLNPIDREQFEEETHKRTLAKKRREKELFEAERDRLTAQRETLKTQHGLEADEEFKGLKFAAGAARFDQKIAERRVGEAIARASMEPESKTAVEPSKPVSIAVVIADYIQTLEKEIDEAEAAGNATTQMRNDIATLKALLKRT